MGLRYLGKAIWLLPALCSWASRVSAQTPAAGPAAMAAGQTQAETAASSTGTPSPAPAQANTQPAETAAASPAATATPALPVQPAPAAVNLVDGPSPQPPGSVGEKPAPRELPYYDGEPAPQGYQLVERPRRGLVIAGALALGIPYAISVSVAAGGQYNSTTGWLLIPVVGPWITAARIEDDHCDDTTGSCGNAQGERGLAAFDGIAQAAGAAMLVVGMTVPKRLWVRDTTAELSVLPARIGRDGYGLVGVGRF
jgi:hypothetical protein